MRQGSQEKIRGACTEFFVLAQIDAKHKPYKKYVHVLARYKHKPYTKFVVRVLARYVHGARLSQLVMCARQTAELDEADGVSCVGLSKMPTRRDNNSGSAKYLCGSIFSLAALPLTLQPLEPRWYTWEHLQAGGDMVSIRHRSVSSFDDNPKL